MYLLILTVEISRLGSNKVQHHLSPEVAYLWPEGSILTSPIAEFTEKPYLYICWIQHLKVLPRWYSDDDFEKMLYANLYLGYLGIKVNLE